MSEWNFQDRGSPHPHLSAFRDDSRSFESACASDRKHHPDVGFPLDSSVLLLPLSVFSTPVILIDV